MGCYDMPATRVRRKQPKRCYDTPTVIRYSTASSRDEQEANYVDVILRHLRGLFGPVRLELDAFRQLHAIS